MEVGCVSAVAWVPRGAAKAVPERYKPTAEEIESIKQELMGPGTSKATDDADMEMQDEEGGVGKVNGDDDEDDVDKKYNMKDYDDEPDNSNLFSKMEDLMVMDEEGEEMLQDESDDESLEDLRIDSTDNVLLAAVTDEEQQSSLHVLVMEQEDDPSQPSEAYSVSRGNMYVHHDVMLPTFPLCVEWINHNVAKAAGEGITTGNFVAVGTFLPIIEIWNLDVVDDMQPAAALGTVPNAPAGKKKKKNQKKKKGETLGGLGGEHTHTDAVLSLAWNSKHRNVLGSASADKTVKLWNLDTLQSLHTYTHHTNKVGAMAWNPQDSNVLLTGGYDRTIAVLDVRSPQSGVAKWKTGADVECVAWNPATPTQFIVGTEDGSITCHDMTKPQETIYTLKAHDKEISGVHFNPRIPNYLATASGDKTVKLWDVADNKPNMLHSFPSPLGKLFSCSFCMDDPFLLALGGVSANVEVLNTIMLGAVARRYGNLAQQAGVNQGASASASGSK